jgi:RNA polymerase sigma-70 factor (ECF subfamily)
MERQLVERARRGDREAYETLVRRKVAAVYRTALAVLGNEADAHDAVQDAFLAAWRRLPSLRDADRFDAWLGRITLNACRMALRRRRGVREIAMTDQAEPRATAGAAREPADPATSDLEAASVSADAFDRAFGRLSVDQRALIVLHHLDGLPVADIGARLGIPTGTVKSRLHHARLALERALAREDRP